MQLPIIGALALAGRAIGLGLERPLVKALGDRRNSVAATTIYFGFAVVMLLPFIAWQHLSGHDQFSLIGQWIIPACITGIVYAISFHSYVRAMSIGEVSYLAPLYAAAFIWLYLLDLYFGGARFGWFQAVGLGCVVVGVIFLNVRSGVSTWHVLNPATVLRQPGAVGMLVYSFGLATARMVDKSVAGVAPPVLYAFLNNLPTVLVGILILAATKNLAALTGLARERFWVAVIGSSAGMAAYVLLLVAMDYFNPSMIEPVTQSSVLLSVWLGWLWFNEKIHARWLAALLIVTGALLLLLSPA